MTRRSVSDSLGLIAWTRNPGRLMDLGRVFAVRPKIIGFPRLRSRWSAPIRYALSMVLTVTWLLRTRPKVVIVCCPPPFASALVAIYARISNATFILDAHPGAFGHRDRLWNLFVPLQKLLVSRARVTMVTDPSLAEAVHEWGGRPLVFHEAPPPLSPIRPKDNVAARPKVVFTTIFDPDEPVGTITAAACALAECDVAITGDDARLSHDLRRRLVAEPHVRLTGWLDQSQYLALIATADVVVALTCDPHSVMRSAFEAIYLERPTVLSDTATLRGCFSPSVFVEASPTAVVTGVRSVLADYGSWTAQARTRHDGLVERWAGQRADLESVISVATGRSFAGAGVLSDG
jgi:hypothetical protein